MSTGTIALCFLGVTLLALAGIVFYDVGLIERGKESISRMIFLASQADPIVAVLISAPFVFVAGVMFGHWFFGQTK